jgi:hypothetical protein
MASNRGPKLRIALLFGAALTPAQLLAQSAQVSPLPKAPPEIMSNEARDPKACTEQAFTIGPENKPQSAITTGKSLSDQLARSDGVICPPPRVDPHIKMPTPEGGKMPVIPPPGSPGGDPNIRPKLVPRAHRPRLRCAEPSVQGQLVVANGYQFSTNFMSGFRNEIGWAALHA